MFISVSQYNPTPFGRPGIPVSEQSKHISTMLETIVFDHPFSKIYQLVKNNRLLKQKQAHKQQSLIAPESNNIGVRFVGKAGPQKLVEHFRVAQKPLVGITDHQHIGLIDRSKRGSERTGPD